MLRLIDGLLRAGYMEDWRYGDTLSGTPDADVINGLGGANRSGFGNNVPTPNAANG